MSNHKNTKEKEKDEWEKALKALKCPNCEANIQVDDDRDFGFCSYCGAQVQVREVVEVRYSGEIQLKESDDFEKQLEDGDAYLKMEDYHKAEQILYRVINKYPGRAEGYEMLLRAITRDGRVFIKENYDRVMKLADKMMAVASPEQKDACERMYQSICEGFEVGIEEQKRENALRKVGKLNKMQKENLIICVVAVLAFVACVFFMKGSLWYFPLMVVLGTVAVLSAFTVLVCKVRKVILLKKGNK